MSKNIEININNGTTYETLYPKTLGSLVDGKVSSSTQSDSANTLTTGRTIRTNLASTSTATFDGSSNITPGVSGTLTVSNGGTGVTSYSALFNQLKNYMNYASLVSLSGSYIGDGTKNRTITLSTSYTIKNILLFGVFPSDNITYLNKTVNTICIISPMLDALISNGGAQNAGSDTLFNNNTVMATTSTLVSYISPNTNAQISVTTYDGLELKVSGYYPDTPVFNINGSTYRYRYIIDAQL